MSDKFFCLVSGNTLKELDLTAMSKVPERCIGKFNGKNKSRLANIPGAVGPALASQVSAEQPAFRHICKTKGLFDAKNHQK